MNFRFEFTPDARLASTLERVFGAARWVHNQGLLIQWRAVLAKEEMPTRAELVSQCIDTPITHPDTAWLGEMPRAVLLDEIDDLVEYVADLPSFKTERELPLRRKKGDQDMYFPKGAFFVLSGEGTTGRGQLRLDKVGVLELPIPAEELFNTIGKIDTVKIERSRSMTFAVDMIPEGR